MQEPAALRERFDDHRVGRIHLQAGHERDVGQEAPVVADRVGHRQAVALPDREILVTVPGGGVDRAGARIERHVLPEYHRHLPVLERVLQLQSLERAALELRQHRSAGQAEALEGRFQELGCHDQPAPPLGAGSGLREHVAKLRPQRHGLIRRQRPGRRGPDHDVHGHRAELGGAQADARRQISAVSHAKRHVDRR